jgi:YD repeat-containing protein
VAILIIDCFRGIWNKERAKKINLSNQMYLLFLRRSLLVGFFSISFFLSKSLKAQEVQVDPMTGSPNIAIPIYTLNYGSLSIPVNLVYSANGLTVNDGEGDAGFGWNLSCNYGVFRDVRGFPDFGNGALNANTIGPSSNDNLSNTDYADEASDYNSLSSWGNTTDSQPDVFTVTGPGLYLQFVFDATGVPRLLNYQDVSVSYSGGNFTIVNNKGWTYQYSNQMQMTRKTYLKSSPVDMFTTDMNYYMPTGGISFVSAWYLTTVTDEKGNVINFSYASPSTSEYSVSSWKTRITQAGVQDTLYYLLDNFSPVKLRLITAGNYKVDFYDYTRPLHDITVSENGLSDMFSYRFTYQLVKSSSDSKEPYISHYFLTSVMPFNSCVPQTPYTFFYQGVDVKTNPNTYSSVELPWKSLLNQDMWGYYNAVSNNVPQIYYYQFLTDSRRFSIQQIGGTPTLTLSGTNRDVSAAKVGNGALVKIGYPTGGNVRIIWERNKYFDSSVGKVFFGPGLRVGSIITDGGEAAYGRNPSATNSYHQIRKDYVYVKSDTDTTSSGQILYPPVLAFATGSRFIRLVNNQYPQTQVHYGRVKEKMNGQGSRVYEYSLPAMYPSTSYNNEWFASYSKIARNQSTHMALSNVQNGYYTFPFAPNPNYDFERGLLTKESEYAETGTWVREKKYEYVRLSPALQVVYGVKFEYLSPTDCDCFHFSKYQHITGTTKMISKITTREISELNNQDTSRVTTYYHYNNDYVNNNFLMDSIRTVYKDGSVIRQKIKYVKDFAAISNPTSGDVMANSIKAMLTARRHGEWVEKYDSYKPSGGTEIITGSTLRIFKAFSSGKPYIYKTFSLPQGLSFIPATVGGGASQSFIYDQAHYVLTSTTWDYDNAGNALSLTDNKNNTVSYHYAQNYSLDPVAFFTNAKADQVVYDGFEFNTGHGFNTGHSATIARTGNYSGVISTGVIYSYVFNNAKKSYRVSCWVNGASGTVTFKLLDGGNQNNVLFTLAPLNNPNPNQWTYLEGVLVMPSNPPATLAVSITATSVMQIDDVVILPIDATSTSTTYLPLKGVTSQTDDRGNSTVFTYDPLGRKYQTFDRQRNLTELYDYQFKGQPTTPVVSTFLVTNMEAGQSQTVIANTTANCFGSISYAWTLDGVSIGSTSTLSLYISNPGQHNLKLRVTNTATGVFAESAQNFCVTVPYTTAPSVTLSANTTIDTQCGNGVNFTASASSGCARSTYLYTWYMSTNGGVSFTVMSGYSSNVAFAKMQQNYIVKVKVIATCSSNDSNCPGTTTNSAVQTISITYRDDRNGSGSCI